MAYKELEVDELIEIDSVSSFIRAVKDSKSLPMDPPQNYIFVDKMRSFGILSQVYSETVCLASNTGLCKFHCRKSQQSSKNFTQCLIL